MNSNNEINFYEFVRCHRVIGDRNFLKRRAKVNGFLWIVCFNFMIFVVRSKIFLIFKQFLILYQECLDFFEVEGAGDADNVSFWEFFYKAFNMI